MYHVAPIPIADGGARRMEYPIAWIYAYAASMSAGRIILRTRYRLLTGRYTAGGVSYAFATYLYTVGAPSGGALSADDLASSTRQGFRSDDIRP